MSEFITREEHTQTIQRVHDRIDPINESSIRIEESSKHIEALVMSMHVLIHGNGKEGLITKISNLFVRVRNNQWFVRSIFLIIITTAGFVIRSSLK